MPRGTAARVEGWRRWTSGRFGAILSTPSGTLAAGTLVELQLGGSWVNITGFVRYAQRVAITRGRTDEAAQVERCTIKLTLDNTDGRFTPRNPLGAYYGLIGRNTPLRVSVPYLGGRAFRAHGEVSTWPVRWDLKGVDVNVPIEASGILRRLSQGAATLKSAPRRFYEASSASTYRHLEEGPLTPFSSTAAKVNFRYGEGKLAAWLPPSLQINGITGTSTGIALTNVTTPATTGWAVDFMYATDTDKTFTARVFDAGDPGFSGAVKFIASTTTVELFYTLTATGVDQSLGTTSTSAPFDNKPHHVRFTAQQNGNNIDFQVYLDGALLATGTKTSASAPVAGVDQFWLFPYAGSDGSFLAIGHVAASVLSSAPSVTSAATAALGHQQETAGRRIQRLCSEEGIEFTSVGDLDLTTPLGPQYPDTLVKILREAGDTDAGILYEPRHHLGFAYRTRASLYNQTPRLALDYSASGFIAELEPVDDDQQTRNDVTATRREGGSARDVQETGPLSILPPEQGGVGVYDEDVPVNVAGDGFLPDHASWRLHLGTVDEPRYPVVGGFVNDQEISEGLRLALLDCDIGDRVTVDSPPAWLPPGQISALVQGTREVIDDFVYELEFNTSPASPYQVGTFDEASRYDTPGTTLDAAVDGTVGSFTVSTIGGIIWGTQTPYDLKAGLEQVTVTAVSGSSPAGQVLTVTRSVNGVVQAHDAGTALSLFTPSVYAL